MRTRGTTRPPTRPAFAASMAVLCSKLVGCRVEMQEVEPASSALGMVGHQASQAGVTAGC
jgi:hypothetical protein